MTNQASIFSWKSIAVAPLPVPLVASLLLAAGNSKNRLFDFLFFFAPGCLFSYSVCIALFLPCLWMSSRFTRLTLWRTGLLGAVLGLAVYLPVAWQSYLASGDNSGPPSDSFLGYLWRYSWGESWIFCVGGLVTAVTYWLLAGPRPAGLR